MYVHIFAANVCNTISVCCQLNFQVVSDHTRPCECVSVYEFDSLSSCLSVCVYLSVCLPCGCIQLYSDSFLASVVGVKSIRGSRVGEGEEVRHWSCQQLLQHRCLPAITESETQNAQRETETEARFRATTDPHNLHLLFFSLSPSLSLFLSLSMSLCLLFLFLFFPCFTSTFFVRLACVYFDTIKMLSTRAHTSKAPGLVCSSPGKLTEENV